MANIKKISVNKLESIVNNFENDSVKKWHELDVSLKYSICIDDMIYFVNSVVNNCFLDNGEYVPEVKEFIIQKNLIEKYTNIKMPTNYETCYNIINKSDIIEFILDNINLKQYNEILNAIDNKIDFKCELSCSSVSAKVSEIVNQLSEMSDNMNKTLSGISMDDVSKVLNVISKVDDDVEGKIVSEYIKQSKLTDK